MPKKSNSNAEKKICETALRLIAAYGWQKLTLEQIAKTAKISLVQVKKLFVDKNELLPAFVRLTDQEVTSSFGKTAPGGEPHDRLFEVMMARFDSLQKHRAAILNAADEIKRNPTLAQILLPAHIAAMKKMLSLAKLKQNGLKEMLVIAAMLAIYALTLHAWQQDNTSDMSRTMATLDRHLKRAGKVAETLLRAF